MNRIERISHALEVKNTLVAAGTDLLVTTGPHPAQFSPDVVLLGRAYADEEAVTNLLQAAPGDTSALAKLVSGGIPRLVFDEVDKAHPSLRGVLELADVLLHPENRKAVFIDDPGVRESLGLAAR